MINALPFLRNAALTCTLMAAINASAEVSWSLVAGLGYDDNVSLRYDESDGSSIAAFRADVTLSKEDRRQRLKVGASSRVTSFGDESLDTTDAHSATLSYARSGKRLSWGLDISGTKDSPLEEQDQVGVDAPLDGTERQTPTADSESGLISTQIDRLSYSLSPNFTYALGRRWSLVGNARYSGLDYDQRGASLNPLIEHAVVSWELGVAREISRAAQISARTYRSDFKPDGRSDVRVRGAKVRIRQEFGRTSAALLQVGRAEVSRQQLSSEVTGWTYLGRLSHQQKRGAIYLSVSKDFEPTGFGEVAQFERVALNYVRVIGRPLSWRVGVSHSDVKEKGSSIGIERRYLEVSQSLEWKMSRRLSIALSTRYRDAKRTAFSGERTNGLRTQIEVALRT